MAGALIGAVVAVAVGLTGGWEYSGAAGWTGCRRRLRGLDVAGHRADESGRGRYTCHA
jgi:hypothetical protein